MGCVCTAAPSASTVDVYGPPQKRSIAEALNSFENKKARLDRALALCGYRILATNRCCRARYIQEPCTRWLCLLRWPASYCRLVYCRVVDGDRVILIRFNSSVQVAYSRPDFGIRGTIDGVSNVNARAILVKEYFLRVNDYIIPDQKSDIATLRDAAKTLQAIGQSVNNLGPALMDALTTATDNDSGDVNATFALINMARLNFEGYVEINLNEQILNLNTLLGMHVRDQLVDDFYHISNRLAESSPPV